MNEIENLKSLDPDRFLLSLFINNLDDRRAITDFDMLNIEIGRLRDVIETPHMGLIRLKWWEDEIDKIYEDKAFAPHPLLSTLQHQIKAYHIPQHLIRDLITAREADFEEYDDFILADYAQDIHAPLMVIKAHILKIQHDRISDMAKAYAMVGLVRSIPYYRFQSQIRIPDIQPEAVKNIVLDIERILHDISVDHPYVKAHVTLTRLYLKHITSCGYDLNRLKPLAFKELRLWWGVKFSA
jgi:hypothetical protein